MKKAMSLLMTLAPLIALTQGIQWSNELSWEVIKQKAKQDNKCIFLDVYTTWCGPCKMMDKSTFVNDSVGNYFNERFISVKVQMDKTENDNERTKSWYKISEYLGKQYHVEGYPTYIFFNPKGEVVHKAMGFSRPAEFIAIAKAATAPGKVYIDKYIEFDDFIKAFKGGLKDYKQFPAMIEVAFKSNDTANGYALMKELTNYVLGLPRDERYTKDRVKMWASFNIPSKSRVFQFFYKDGKVIDKVMGHKGYAAEAVDRTIQAEITQPFMEQQARGSATTMNGMYITGNRPSIDSSEADWKLLYATIKKQFNAAYARRAVLTARADWYRRHQNNTAFVKYSLIHLKKYEPNFMDGLTLTRINIVCWSAFINLTDTKVLTACLPWIKELVQRYPKAAAFADTYANLLYKLGRKQEALVLQEKAALLAPGDYEIKAALDNMRRGGPTYVEQGAVWFSGH